MKKSIHILSILALCLTTALGSAQTEEISVPLSNPGDEGKLTVHVTDGSITVEGHNADNVVVIANRRSGGKSHKKREKNGLKKVGDNSLSFTVEEYNNEVKIRNKASNGLVDFTVKVPRNFSVNLRTVNKGSIRVDGLNGTHEVSNTNGPVDMTNVGGSVIADALNKDITVQFSQVFDDTNMMFTSLNGDIDVTFPSNLKATIWARSDNGDVYSDFEMVTTKSQQRKENRGSDGVYRVTQEKGITASINGGGIEIGFKTLNGDILIRSN